MRTKLIPIKKLSCWLPVLVFVLSLQLFAVGDEKDKNDKPIDLDKTEESRVLHFNSRNEYNQYRFNQYLTNPDRGVYFNLAFPVPSLLQGTVDMQKLRSSFRFHLIDPDDKRLTRALLMGVGHFVYGASSYWIRQDVNAEDWEFHFNWKEQSKRIFQLQGVRFDSNTFGFNWTHSLAGALYYNYARTNNLNKLESFAYTFTSSLLWETFVEFKEVLSVNDMITTPMGGISIGESMFQLGRYFRSQKPTAFNQVARFLSNPVMFLNDFLDRKNYPNQYAQDANDYWHDIRLYLGSRFDSASGFSNSLFRVGFQSQLINLPEYGTPGISNYLIQDTLLTEFNIGLVMNKQGIYGTDIFAKSVLGGYFFQNIRDASGQNEDDSGRFRNPYGLGTPRSGSPADERHGYSLFIGAATAFDLVQNKAKSLSENERDHEDKYTIINLIGPTVDFTFFRKNLQIRFVSDAYANFALMHSQAFKAYSDVYPVGTNIKCTLRDYNYYYALGVTLSSLLQVHFSNFELKGRLIYHYLDSIEGLDRFQKRIQLDDFDLKDSRRIYHLSIGYRLPHMPVQLLLGMESINRWGSVKDFTHRSDERRSYFQVNYLL
ncbi:MAG: DUF3943 domain-containing protein [Candidatus Omnitrophota bacterium]